MQRARFDKTMFRIIRDADQNVQGIVMLRLLSPHVMHSLLNPLGPNQTGWCRFEFVFNSDSNSTNKRSRDAHLVLARINLRQRSDDFSVSFSFIPLDSNLNDQYWFSSVCVATGINTQAFVPKMWRVCLPIILPCVLFGRFLELARSRWKRATIGDTVISQIRTPPFFLWSLV